MELRSLFMRQAIMRKVLISLLPILLFAVYSFGLRILVVLAVVTAAGVLTRSDFALHEAGVPRSRFLRRFSCPVSCLP